MLLSLADLALRGGERYEQTYPLDIDPVLLGGVAYQVLVPGGVTLVVDRVTGGYLLDVSLDANIYGPCARCLAESVLHVHAEQREFAPTARDGWDEFEGSDFIKDLMVDIAGLAREALVLALPPQVVCKDECSGLCALCGHDLNLGPCDCKDEEVDGRWGRLKDLDLGETETP
jgi:uncharacterized protein